MIPRRASDQQNVENDIPKKTDAYVANPYSDKPILTFAEALDAINILSGQLIVDGWQRDGENAD